MINFLRRLLRRKSTGKKKKSAYSLHKELRRRAELAMGRGDFQLPVKLSEFEELITEDSFFVPPIRDWAAPLYYLGCQVVIIDD